MKGEGLKWRGNTEERGFCQYGGGLLRSRRPPAMAHYAQPMGSSV